MTYDNAMLVYHQLKASQQQVLLKDLLGELKGKHTGSGARRPRKSSPT